MTREVPLYNASAEDLLPKMTGGQFNVVFTMSVLMHIHPASQYLFRDIARVTKDLLITIEDEKTLVWGHFPRNYLRIFETFELYQISETNCSDIKGLNKDYVTRVFNRERRGE